MTNLEILKKAFKDTGYNCEFEEENDKLYVTVSLFGVNKEFVFSATYDESVNLDYVIQSLKTDFNYTEVVSNEEGWFVTALMEKYIKELENNGIYACESIINTWESEANGLEADWSDLEHKLEESLDKIIKEN